MASTSRSRTAPATPQRTRSWSQPLLSQSTASSTIRSIVPSFKRILVALALLWAGPAFSQAGIQFPAGQILGNSTAATRGGQASTVTSILDRAFTGAQGMVLNRGASNWTATRTPVIGFATGGTGTLGFAGTTSGTATITAQAVAGTPTLTLPNASGTFAISATSPLTLSATTGALTCTTCTTNAAALTTNQL